MSPPCSRRPWCPLGRSATTAGWRRSVRCGSPSENRSPVPNGVILSLNQSVARPSRPIWLSSLIHRTAIVSERCTLVDARGGDLPDSALPVDYIYRETTPVLFGHYPPVRVNEAAGILKPASGAVLAPVSAGAGVPRARPRQPRSWRSRTVHVPTRSASLHQTQ